MRVSAVVLPCLVTPALCLAAELETATSADTADAEDGFRTAWHDTFVEACSGHGTEGGSEPWCRCVADEVLNELAFDELLRGDGFDRALEPATAVCDARERARQVTL